VVKDGSIGRVEDVKLLFADLLDEELFESTGLRWWTGCGMPTMRLALRRITGLWWVILLAWRRLLSEWRLLAWGRLLARSIL